MASPLFSSTVTMPDLPALSYPPGSLPAIPHAQQSGTGACHNGSAMADLLAPSATAPSHPAGPAGRPSLAARVPSGGTTDPDEILDRFVDWVAEVGFELYPAQEEALLEILAGKHVILNTPTGSGKSLG